MGMTPLTQTFDSGTGKGTVNYDSWKDSWFVRNNYPVALTFDGREAFRLDKSDLTKRADGTLSHIDQLYILSESEPYDFQTNFTNYYTKDGDNYLPLTGATEWIADIFYYKNPFNYMTSIPLCYVKRYSDDRYCYVLISNEKIDESFNAFSHTDKHGVVKSHVYAPIFKGCVIDGRLRSIGGQLPQGDMTITQGRDYASNIYGVTVGRQIMVLSLKELIKDLLILLAKKNDNSQMVYGNGNMSNIGNSSNGYGKIKTGSNGYNLGQFCGFSNDESHVVTFYMEDFYGNRLDWIDGILFKYPELNLYTAYTPQVGYNSEGTGYVAIPPLNLESNSGYQTKLRSDVNGTFPIKLDGSSTTYNGDSYTKTTINLTESAYVAHGGYCLSDKQTGISHIEILRNSDALWYVGCSPCLK